MAKTKTAIDKAYDSYKALTRYYAKKSGTGYEYISKQEYSEAQSFLSQKEISMGSVMSEDQKELFVSALEDMVIDDKYSEDMEDINKLLNKQVWNKKDRQTFFDLIDKYELNLKDLYYAE